MSATMYWLSIVFFCFVLQPDTKHCVRKYYYLVNYLILLLGPEGAMAKGLGEGTERERERFGNGQKRIITRFTHTKNN